MYQLVIKQQIAVLEEKIREIRSDFDSGKIGFHSLSKIVDYKELKERKSRQAELHELIDKRIRKICSLAMSL